MQLDPTAYLEAIEAEMQAVVRPPRGSQAPLYAMLQYHLGWITANGRPVQGARGKRLRPLLCLLACEAVGGDWRRAVPAAAAIELVHNFTLIHDDIEDNSPTRHGRPTVWKLWGTAQAINAGDALWSLARLAIHRLAEQGYGARTILEAAHRLDATCLALCEGQHLDISFEGRLDVTEQAYGAMIAGKTAALLSAATAIGALLGKAEEPTMQALAEFGRELGLAFQMTDDLLGIWGDPVMTGKSAASDLATRKMTLPVIHALAWEAQRGEQTLSKLYGQEPMEHEDLQPILERLEAAGSQGYVRQRAQEHTQRMLATLGRLGLQNAAIHELERLALRIVGRER
jgi:geranylgeranyl diphosphate synthase, type I